MLQHIALTINDSEEIKNFYENILLFSTKHKFSVNKKISLEIFKIDKEVDVFMMENHDTQLEIFLSQKKEKKYFHIFALHTGMQKSHIKRQLKWVIKPWLKRILLTTPTLSGTKAVICLKLKKYTNKINLKNGKGFI